VHHRHRVPAAGHRQHQITSGHGSTHRRFDTAAPLQRRPCGERHWTKVAPLLGRRLFFDVTRFEERRVESQGPLAILWVGIGLCCFYIALVWLNTLLGFFLTPLFLIPATWLMDRRKRRDERHEEKRNG
jgi:Flp pilus assembly protein TadB